MLWVLQGQWTLDSYSYVYKMIKLWRSWGELGDRLIDKHSGYHQQPRRLRKGGILSLGGKRWVIHILEFFRAGEIGGNLKIINVVKHRNVFKGCAHLASHRKDHHQRNEIFAHKQQSHWRQMFLNNQPACLRIFNPMAKHPWNPVHEKSFEWNANWSHCAAEVDSTSFA